MSDPVSAPSHRQRRRRWSVGIASAVAVVAVGVAGCAASAPPAGPVAAAGAPGASRPGSPPPAAPSPEVNPSGDIPDNQAYVPYPGPNGLFTVSVPEGWARSVGPSGVSFTDKLNTVRIETAPRPQAPTEATAQAQDVPALAGSVPGYNPGRVSTVNRTAGNAVLVTYQARSAPAPVTGKSTTDAVERYEFWRAGQEVALTLSGPVGADNVDPWRMVTDSLRWQR